MSPVAVEATIPETASCSSGSRRFGELRGVQWRIGLGILPSSPSASIDDLRRVNANSRRRYASLRRRLLVDPHVPKDGSNSPDLVMDNPLSQNPDSIWSRFFRNAELEKMVDQDLTRLYPERGSYFQTSGCQGILRRILLLWCLRNPEYGYRQGMHELLAPLLYVLHVDVETLSEVRKLHNDHFADKFDDFSFYENGLTYKFDFKKFSDFNENRDEFGKSSIKAGSPSELDPEIQTIILLSDAYGAEGELGIVLSDKFLEHDAYSMFDALMAGPSGSVSMAEFFSHSPSRTSNTGLPPVIEASTALYHLLSIVDSSLHTHLVELGVEPQYFALRWLRVLFGREFSLEDLLIIWDEIFARENMKKEIDSDSELNFGILGSTRGAFISAFAVSMILNLRSSLLATETATVCLQRLLNFPADVNLVKLLAKAKSLQDRAIDANNSKFLPIHFGFCDGRKSLRGHSLSLDLNSSGTPLSVVPDSYWEEKWRILHKEEEDKRGEEQVPVRRNGWSERVKLRLSRTESDPSPSDERTKITKKSVRRNLLDDLSRQLGSNKDNEGSEENSSNYSDPPSSISGDSNQENEPERSSIASNSFVDENDAGLHKTITESSPLLVSATPDEFSSKFSRNENITGKLATDTSERSSNASNLFANDAGFCGTNTESSPLPVSEPPGEFSSKFSPNEKINGKLVNDGTITESSHLPVSDTPDDFSSTFSQNENKAGKLTTNMKEVKLLSGKFQWFWKFRRNTGEGMSEKRVVPEDAKIRTDGGSSSVTSKGETVDQNAMVSLKNISQSMLENIQVIESVFQQDSSKNDLVDKRQVTAVSALKELRKISNLLSEM